MERKRIVVILTGFAAAVVALPQTDLPLPIIPTLPKWFPPVWEQSLAVPVVTPESEQTPGTIPQFAEHNNSSGKVATYQPRGETVTASNAYFKRLGRNGRTCFTCHQPQAAWGLDPASAQNIFNATRGKDPLFAPVDGTNCPDSGAAARTLEERRAASSQLLQKGNIRVFIPIPQGAEFKVRILRDPYGCNTSPKYGIRAGILSMYRRILSATTLSRNAELDAATGAVRPQGTIMWDGREPSLESQFRDATLGHAQAKNPPTDAEIAQGVSFETGIFTAQNFSNAAGSLTAAGAVGGPVNQFRAGRDFVPTPSIPLAFNHYTAWVAPTSNAAQASINRGQTIFNTKTFSIRGVTGLNDIGQNPSANSTCSTCHNTLHVGSDVIPGGRHLGIGDNSAVDKTGNQTTATALPPTSDQPLFSFLCPVGSIGFFSNPTVVDGTVYDEFQTTDPGMGLITGKCNDLGKFKVPRLNGLASRAPFFHNGNAASLREVVNFYNTRFNIGLSAQEQDDLVHFLDAL